jgi:hypothetical protein
MDETHIPFPWRFDRDRYSGLYLMRHVTEEQVQSDILHLLHTYQVDAVPIDAGGKRQRGRFMGAARDAGVDLEGIQNTKTGRAIPAGFADLEATLAPDGRAMYIEVKAPLWINADDSVVRAAGVASIEQIEFLCSKFERGALVMVAWSSQDVERHVGELLQENRKALGPKASHA